MSSDRHSDAEPFLKSGAPATAGLFTIPSKRWNVTNMQFVHQVGGKEIKEIPKPPHTESRRFPVPIQQVPDITDFVYGDMPQALTLRPLEETGCCTCDMRYDVARDMFADPIAEVKVAIPKCLPMFLCGMVSADVELGPKSGQTGVVYKGVYKKSFLPGCCVNDTTLIWEGQSTKPYMSYRLPSQIDSLKYCFCQSVHVGWRGSSESVAQSQVLYDNSIILKCSDACNLFCIQCKNCQNCCCAAYDLASRWTRPEDVRRLVASKYDYEFSFRKLDEEVAIEMSEGEAGDLNIFAVQQPTQRVDALFGSRLYMDVKCGRPTVRFSNPQEADKSILAAVDARYRGSVDHANPSEDDHLVVLAGLIMHAMATFPNKANAPYRPGPADQFRGRLIPRIGGGYGAAMPTNAV